MNPFLPSEKNLNCCSIVEKSLNVQFLSNLTLNSIGKSATVTSIASFSATAASVIFMVDYTGEFQIDLNPVLFLRWTTDRAIYVKIFPPITQHIREFHFLRRGHIRTIREKRKLYLTLGYLNKNTRISNMP